MVRVELYVRRERELVVSPRSLHLVPSGGRATAALFVKDRAGGPVSGLRWSAEPPDACTLEYDEASGRLSVTAAAAPPGETRELTVVLTDPAGEVVRVPVRVGSGT